MTARELLEQQIAAALTGGPALDPAELELLAQRAAEAIALAAATTPRKALAALLAAAPADAEWEALYLPAWRGQARQFRAAREAEQRLQTAAARALLASAGPIPQA